MKKLTLPALARIMKSIDICMMTTFTKSGKLNSRPMSNNKDVTYKGDSYYFTFDKTDKIKELMFNPHACLHFAGKDNMYIMVNGKASLIRDKEKFSKHWDKSLDRWFEEGIETKGIVLIHIKGTQVKYWQNEKQGELKLGKLD